MSFTTTEPPVGKSTTTTISPTLLDPILQYYLLYWFNRGITDTNLEKGDTPIIEATRNCDEASIFMLLLYENQHYSTDSNSNNRNTTATNMLHIQNSKTGETAIHVAAALHVFSSRSCYTIEKLCSIMKLLLDHDKCVMMMTRATESAKLSSSATAAAAARSTAPVAAATTTTTANLVDMKTKHGDTALHLLAKKTSKTSIKEMLRYNKNIVRLKKKIEILLARLLIEHGANLLSIYDSSGETPVSVAASCGNLDMLELFLVQVACNKNLLSYYTNNQESAIYFDGGSTALHVAAMYNQYDSLRVLLTTSTKTITSTTSDIAATSSSSSTTTTTISNIISSCSSILLNSRNELNETPLHIAAKKGYYESVLVLCKLGSNLNLQTNKGLTPLHCACNCKSRTVVLNNDDNDEYHSDDLSSVDSNYSSNDDDENYDDENDGKTKNTGRRRPKRENRSCAFKVADILLQYGAGAGAGGEIESSRMLHKVTRGGQTPLHLAVKRGNEQIVRLLIDRGADINVEDNYGYTPMKLANRRRNKHMHLVRLLSSLGAT